MSKRTATSSKKFSPGDLVVSLLTYEVGLVIRTPRYAARPGGVWVMFKKARERGCKFAVCCNVKNLRHA